MASRIPILLDAARHLEEELLLKLHSLGGGRLGVTAGLAQARTLLR